MLLLVAPGAATAHVVTFVDLDHEPAEPAEDDLPTCVATVRISGEELDTDVEPRSGVGEFRAVLTAPDDLGPIDLRWSATIGGRPARIDSALEVVAGQVATVPAVLAHPDLRARAGGIDRHRVAALISEFTVDVVTRYRGESPVVRRTVEEIPPGRSLLRWPLVRSIDAITLDGVPVDPDDRRLAYRRGPALVDYTHGWADVPASLDRACAAWCAATIVAEDAGMSRDALWETTESGTIRYSTPDWSRGRPTGLIAVDAVLNAMPDHREPGIG